MPKEVITPKNVYQARGFSHAIKVGNIIYVAGQPGLDENSQPVAPGDIVAQTERAYENLKRVLEEAGASLTDIVKMDIYVTDINAFGKTREVRRRYFGSHYPASTAVQVDKLIPEGSMVEISAIAVVD